jgi:hypothetical protein
MQNGDHSGTLCAMSETPKNKPDRRTVGANVRSAHGDHDDRQPAAGAPQAEAPEAGEIGGPAGPEPTRYGDWERKGRCIDF